MILSAVSTRPVDAAALTVGVAIALALASGVWRVARLRSDMISEFRSRLNLGQAGLDDRASITLRVVAERVNEVLGGLDQDFNPSQALGNPEELRSLVELINTLLQGRRRMPRYYRGLLSIGPILIAMLIPALAAELVCLSYFSGLTDDRLLGYIALWVAVGFVGLAALTAGRYILLLHLFSGIEVLAQEEQP